MQFYALRNLMKEGAEMRDLVDREGFWSCDYFTSNQLLPQQCHISPAVEEMYSCSQATSSFLQLQHHLFGDMIVAHNTLKVKSAFIRYNKESSNGVQLNRKSFMNQKLIKKCFSFLRRIHENEREKSIGEVDDCFKEDSYASTHRIAERNRRIKLTQQFSALRNLLSHNLKKADKYSILSNAIVELNQLKLRIKELEQRNKTLMNEVTQHTCEGYGSMSYGNVEDLGKHPLMASICEEAVVVIEESDIGDEKAILHVTLRNIVSNSRYMEAIVTLVKFLEEMKLGIGRIQCRDLDSMNPVIEVAIQKQTTGRGWEPLQRQQLEEVVKRALNAA